MKTWVIDTNVVVSGLLTPNGTPARILDLVLVGRIRIAYDARILAEYRDVLHRPRLGIDPRLIAGFLVAMRAQTLVSPRPVRTSGPDADDRIFVEAALATIDRTIVTGNLAHFPREVLHGARALSPELAIRELAREPT